MTFKEKLQAIFKTLGGMPKHMEDQFKKLAEAENIKAQLIKRHGKKMGERIFLSAKCMVAQHKDLSLQEAADQLSHQHEEWERVAKSVAETAHGIGLAITDIFDSLKRFDFHCPPVTDEQKHVRALVFKKKKTQRKNWSKYKKRR